MHSQQNFSPIRQRSWMLHGSISNMLGMPRSNTKTSDAEPRHWKKATLSYVKPTYSATLQEASHQSWHQGKMVHLASADVLVQILSTSSTRRLRKLVARPMLTNSSNIILHGQRGGFTLQGRDRL
ncbi:hypothetical protein MTO96_040420 [Rhipicephalus appendiculatus]